MTDLTLFWAAKRVLLVSLGFRGGIGPPLSQHLPVFDYFFECLILEYPQVYAQSLNQRWPIDQRDLQGSKIQLWLSFTEANNLKPRGSRPYQDRDNATAWQPSSLQTQDNIFTLLYLRLLLSTTNLLKLNNTYNPRSPYQTKATSKWIPIRRTRSTLQ